MSSANQGGVVDATLGIMSVDLATLSGPEHQTNMLERYQATLTAVYQFKDIQGLKWKPP